jgi:hypothetical protein
MLVCTKIRMEAARLRLLNNVIVLLKFRL